jgi:hypothetical protein
LTLAGNETETPMTEAEWLGCEDGELMIQFLAGHPSESDRKLRLFTVACYQQGQYTYPLEEAEMKAVEEYADGQISMENLVAAHYAHYRHLFPGDPDSAFGLVRDAGEHAYSEATRTEEARAAAANLLRDIFGNPFRPVPLNPAWQTPTVVELAGAVYDDRAFDRLPLLADALEQVGCTDATILGHCRQPGLHVRGCWVVDLLLGRA